MNLRLLSVEELRAHARLQMADGTTPIEVARRSLREGDSVTNIEHIVEQLELSLGVWESSDAVIIAPRIQTMVARMRVLRQLILTGQARAIPHFRVTCASQYALQPPHAPAYVALSSL